MDHLTGFITKHRILICIIFLVATVISAVLFFGVKVNYDLVVYLPDEAESTIALKKMQAEFDMAVPNMRVMVPNVTIAEALETKEKILNTDGVAAVLWLDDMADLKKPAEMIDKETLSQYYKDNNAMYSVTVAPDMEVVATDALHALLGEDAAISGNAPYMAYYQSQIVVEVLSASAYLVPLILLILALTTTSWLLPILVLVGIGVAVIINMGTNIIFGSVSYVTQSASPVLQLAVSLDYAIFLLNAFERNRGSENDDISAMRLAIKQSFSSVAASATTTVFGFFALTFMRFKLGSDLGLNLVKGVILSYVSAIVFLPALTLICLKLIDKTKHKRVIPEMPKASSIFMKVRIPALILILLLLVPSYLAQSKTDFIYGNGAPHAKSRLAHDTDLINAEFGESTAIVILVPKGDTGKEAELCAELKSLDHITSLASYVSSVGNSIPDAFLSPKIVSNFYSENYSRIILFSDTGEEGEVAFNTVEAVRATTAKYYEQSWALGQSTNMLDMKKFITADSKMVNGVAILFVVLTLLVTFKSLSLPVIMLLAIESAIWINLSAPYFSGDSLVYLGHLIISSVQLGATIDYAILITDGYIVARKTMPAYDAIKFSLQEHFISLLTSALILSIAGLCLQLSSSMSVVATLGMLLFRGTLLSAANVLMVLPALLLIFDPITARLTWKANFYGVKGRNTKAKTKEKKKTSAENKPPELLPTKPAAVLEAPKKVQEFATTMASTAAAGTNRIHRKVILVRKGKQKNEV